MPSFTITIPDLHRTGPIVEVAVSPPVVLVEALRKAGQEIPKPVKAHALIDTGATNSVVSPAIIESLGLHPVGTTIIRTPSSGKEGVVCNQYMAAIAFPSNLVFETSELIQAPLIGQPIQCLVGRDILKHGTLFYNGYMQTVTFSA